MSKIVLSDIICLSSSAHAGDWVCETQRKDNARILIARGNEVTRQTEAGASMNPEVRQRGYACGD